MHPPQRPIRCLTKEPPPFHNPATPTTTMAELDELVVVDGGAPPEARPARAAGRAELSVEEIIEEHVGALGWAQLIHVFLVSIAWVFDAQSTLVTIFADGQPPWMCKGRGGACPSSMCGLDPGAWEWVRGRKSSTVAEWGLVCDRKFWAGVPASVFFLGSLLGSAFHGRLADNQLGRKKTILLSCILSSLTCFLTSLSPNIWVYALLRFSNGFARSGIGICCLVLSTEVVGRKWRGQVGQYGFFFFTVGFLSIPLVAYPTRTSWRNMYRVLSILPLAYSFLVLPFISESPRWLVIRGRTKEAMDILNKLARINGRILPADLTISNPVSPASTGGGRGRKNESLWSARWAVKRMVLTMATGFGVGFVYYGVQLNVENLNFNLYLSVAVNGLMEIPAVILGSVLLSFMGRRTLFSSSAALAGAACLLCIPFAGRKKGSKGSWAQLAAEAMGFMAASTAFDVLYVYCVELFPTNVRNFAVSMLRQALMLGAAVAPQLVVLGRVSPKLSFVVFGCFSLFSGALTVWLPETRDAPLYETMEQQESEEKRKLQGSPDGGSEVELPVQDLPASAP